MSGLERTGAIRTSAVVTKQATKTKKEKEVKSTEQQKSQQATKDTTKAKTQTSASVDQTPVPNGYHRIVKGETLYRISLMYGVSVSDLIKENPNLATDKQGNKVIEENELLKLPKTAKIPQQAAKKIQNGPIFGQWQIENGKGAFSIMTKFNLYEEELKKLNPDIDMNNIQAGQKFKVPGYQVKEGDTFEQIAKEHDITENMLRELNPNITQLKAGEIINVPKKAGGDIGLGEIEIEVEELVTEENQQHVIKKGDTLSEIAQANKVPLWALMLANEIKDPQKIYENQVLEIPSKEDIAELEKTRQAARKEEKSQKQAPKTHTVAKNEVLSIIAKKYGVPSWALAEKNNITEPNKLSIGKVLEIPTASEIEELKKTNTKNKEAKKVSTKKVKKKTGSTTKPKEPTTGTISSKAGLINHKVKPKDTLQSIANEYGVAVKDLIAYNNLKSISATETLVNKKITNIKIVGNQTAVKSVTGVTQNFIDNLIAIEKIRRSLYTDDCGKLTIGIGHNTNAHKDTNKYRNRKNLSDTEIYSLLARDIIEAQATARKHIPNFDKLSQKQKEAVLSLIFNTGDLQSSPKLVENLNNKKFADAAMEFDQVNGKVDGQMKVLPGLVKRRFSEISTFLEGTKLTPKELKKVMAFVQNMYDEGFTSIENRNNRVDYNAYARKFLGKYIDQGYLKIKS